MTHRDLVTLSQATTFSLPVASVRNVFNIREVQKKYDKLPNDRNNDSLRNTYERMLERGPQRFQVKPSGIPAMEHLYESLPNFADVLDDVKRNVALAQDSRDGLEITPILLLGEPGIGKTHFAKKIANLLGTGMTLVPMSSMTAGWILSGSSSQWNGAKSGKVFEAIVEGQYANPVIVVDEIDKASSDAQYDPIGALYSLLEHDTAKHFTDEFADVSVDASQVIWVATANDARLIPEPILNRMNVFEIEPPSPAEVRTIAQNLYRDICGSHDWGERFSSELLEATLNHLNEMKPRDIRKAIMSGLGNARLNKRYEMLPIDIPEQNDRRSRIGFVQ
jgi:ATP-dependent Lon protease